MAFPENLQFIRTRAGLTQEQLAEQLEVSRQTVSKWESGVSFPEMDMLLRLCDLYDTNLDTLLRGSVEAASVADRAGYDTFMNRFSVRIACSIGAIIAAVALLILLEATALPELLGVAIMLLIITASVVVLVVSGIEHEHFCKKHPSIDDFYPEAEKEAFHHRFVWHIAGGIGAIMFGVVLLVSVFVFIPEQAPYDSIVTAVFLLIVALSVMSFVYAGIQQDKYNVAKYNRDNNPTSEAKKRLDLIGALCGCIMLLATAIFLGAGFLTGRWGSTVWVFPVGGILCGVINVALDPYRD